MKKKIKLSIVIPVCIVLLLIVAGLVFMSNKDISTGRCLVTDNGSILWIDNAGNPVRIIDRTWFGMPDNLETGDEIWLIHANAIAESYPGQVVTYFCSKTGDGSIADIPENTINALKELKLIGTNKSISNVGGADGPTNVTTKEKMLISSDEYYAFLYNAAESGIKDTIFKNYSVDVGEYPYYEMIFVLSQEVEDSEFYSSAEAIARNIYNELISKEYETPAAYKYSFNIVSIEFYTEANRNKGANCTYQFAVDKMDSSKSFEENACSILKPGS